MDDYFVGVLCALVVMMPVWIPMLTDAIASML